MTTLSLALALVLAGPGTPARNARPPTPDTTAGTAATQPSAVSDEEVSQRVRTYLGAIDTPVSAAQWNELGPRAVPALEAVVRDENALPSRRARAVNALSIIGGPEAKSLVVEMARSEDQPFGVRANAIRGAPRVLSSSELGTQLRPVMEKSRDAPVRATAAEVLARHGGAGACTAVRAQVEREPGPTKAQFSRALERCPPETQQPNSKP